MTKYAECYLPLYDMEIPNHTQELEKATEIINNLKFKLKEIKEKKSINDNVHDLMYEETCRILDYVGRLSKSIFNLEDILSEKYFNTYKHSPELGKKIFWEHYDHLHHPYSILKNRCFHILQELDNEYRKKFNQQPPNWKI